MSHMPYDTLFAYFPFDTIEFVCVCSYVYSKNVSGFEIKGTKCDVIHSRNNFISVFFRFAC